MSASDVEGSTSTRSKVSDVERSTSTRSKVSDVERSTSTRSKVSDVKRSTLTRSKVSDVKRSTSTRSKVSDVERSTSTRSKVSTSTRSKVSDVERSTSTRSKVSDVERSTSTSSIVSDVERSTSTRSKVSDVERSTSTSSIVSDVERSTSTRSKVSDVERSTSTRSKLWIHFDITPDKKNAICKYCGISNETRISNLIRHIKACKKHQQHVDQPVTMGIRDEVRKFGCTNKRNWEVEVMKAIIAEAPFAPSDCKEVHSRLMGPIDLDKEIGLYYEQEKEKLANEFKHLTSRVCVSYEIMEEVEPMEPNLNYISITAHFINEDFNLVNKLIGFKKLTDTSESCVVPTIEKCISDWELGDKIFSLTGKEYSNYGIGSWNSFSRRMLDDPYFHLPCYKIGLTSFYSYSLSVTKRAKILNFIDSMRAVRCHMDAFNESAKERGLSPRNEDWVNQYVTSFWDLVCHDPGRREHAVKMLKEAIPYKDVIGNYCSKGHDIDWERFEVLARFSDKVHEIIDTMASFNYPMFNLYFRNHAEIEDILSKKEDYAITIRGWSHDPFWNSKSSTYSRVNKIIFVACALDPRYKLSFLKHYSENIAKRNRPGFTEYTNEIYEFLENYFRKYKRKTAKFANPQEGCTSNSAHLNPKIDGFSMYTKELKKTAPKSELEEYLDDEESVDFHVASFNLLHWWKHNRLRYPVLSKMARDVLAVPTCAYSIKGNMISDLRAFEGVSPQLVEAVICSKDWILTNVQSDPESNN